MRKIKWAIFISLIILFVFLMIDVFKYDILISDVRFYNFITTHFNNPFMTKMFKIITEFGDAIILITLNILAYIFFKDKKIGLLLTISLGSSCLLNLILKNIVQRVRPMFPHLVNASGYSFPSGHSMVSMAFYGLLIYIVYKKVDSKIKYFIITCLVILILLIGLSRIYLGVHYLTDVIAGFALSLAYVMGFVGLIKRIPKVSGVFK